MLKCDYKNMKGLHIENKIIETIRDDSDNIICTFKTEGSTIRNNYLEKTLTNNYTSGNSELVVSDGTNGSTFTNNAALDNGIITYSRLCNTVAVKFSVTSSFNTYTSSNVSLYDDTSDDIINFKSKFDMYKSPSEGIFPEKVAWDITLHYEASTSSGAKISLYRGTELITSFSNLSTSTSYLCSLAISRFDEEYKCLVKIFKGPGASSGLYYNEFVSIGTPTKLFRPAFVLTLGPKSAVYAEPYLNISYESLRK